MKLFCVVGMHRSGTSVVSRLLNLLGAHLGPSEDLMSPRPDNPTGFWESRSVVALHDDLLGQLGGRWDTPVFRDDGWQTEASLEPFRRRARAIVTTHFAEAPIAVWKDPRGSLVLPLWREVCDIAGTILVVRQPKEVAVSLAKRNAMTSEHAAWLWLRYVSSAWRYDPRHLLVTYDALLGRLEETTSRLAAFVGLPPPNETVSAGIADYVNQRGLRKNDAPNGPLMNLAQAIYAIVEADHRHVTAPIVDLLHDRWKSAAALETVSTAAANVLRQLSPKST